MFNHIPRICDLIGNNVLIIFYTAQQPTVVATGGPNIPDWQLPLPTSTHVLPPCFFTMVNYSDHKSKDDHYFTPPFYTHRCGYKFCLRVSANGDGDGKRTHVSL